MGLFTQLSGADVEVIAHEPGADPGAVIFDAIRATADVMTTELVHHEIDTDDSEAAHAQHAP